MPNAVVRYITVLTVLSGCTVGPKYHEPGSAIPSAYSERHLTPETNQVSRISPSTAPIERWWTVFEDPELNSLIHRALEGNRELRLALSRVREARAQRGVVASGLLPEVDFTGGYNRSRGSKNVEIPLGGPTQTPSAGPAQASGGGPAKGALRISDPPGQGAGSAAGSGASVARATGAPLTPFGEGGLPGVTTELFQAGFDSSWEIDVFGGIRRGIEAANADIAAALEDQRAVLVSLLGEVAVTYVQLRTSQARFDIARENLAAQRKTLDIVQAKFNAGFANDLEVAQQAAQVASTAASIPALESSERNAAHMLAFLIGESPGALWSELTERRTLALPGEVPVGIPSDLLRRRPDIREAERRLAAATARIGVAKADLFPRFNLTSAFGFDSSKASSLFDWESHYFTLNPGVSWPVLDWGRIRSNIKVQNERQQQALIQYEDTVQRALKDVEDALVSFQIEQVRRAALAEAGVQAGKAFEISQLRFTNGLIDFLTVLEAQRALFAAQDALAQSENAIRTNLIALYKALGGGWEQP